MGLHICTCQGKRKGLAAPEALHADIEIPDAKGYGSNLSAGAILLHL